MNLFRSFLFHSVNLNKVKWLFLAISISLTPYLWLFSQTKVLGDFVSAFGNIAGFLGATMLLWQFILGIRFISRWITKDYVTITRLHISLGTLGTLFVFIHPLIMLYTYSNNLELFFPNFESQFYRHLLAGQLAFNLFLIIWLASALFRNKMAYRPWLKIHYLSYPLMALVFFHARTIGTYLQVFPLISNYWDFMTLVFGAVVIYRLGLFLNLGKAHYILDSKFNQADGITIYKFKPSFNSIVPKVGQFVYIRASKFGEAHPFSVMRFDEKSGELEFGIKAVGKYTNQLESIKIGSKVYMDGPYGVFTKEGHNNHPKVLIAGGIGITPFVELVNRFGSSNTILFYANKTLDEAVNREQFKKELGSQYIEAVSQADVEDKTIIQGRLTDQAFKSNLPKDYLKKAKFFMCGSPGFMAGISSTLQSLGVSKDRIYAEEFSL